MNNIKFLHHYPKIYGQSSAELLKVKICDRSDLDDHFVEYDTVYLSYAAMDHYSLPTGPLLVLVFLGDKNIPFTTVKRWTVNKAAYYLRNLNKQFKIVYE